jgi:hypothetical protein
VTPADSRRIRRVSDAVVASYIHDISARTGAPAAGRGRRAGGEGPRGGPSHRAHRAPALSRKRTRTGAAALPAASVATALRR